MSLGVFRDRVEVGRLRLAGERSREYTFSYASDATKPISLSLPLAKHSFSPMESRPFFEALLPEGAVRERVASQLRLAAGDSYGLLAELGRDCAGALQILEGARLSDSPAVEWMTDEQLDQLIADLPRHPLGVRAEDGRLRLSLAGVQQKAVLMRDLDGRFGRPLDGMPSTHILKPEPPDGDFPGLAANEFFCMRLAARCGVTAANVELFAIANRPCLVVERFDRDLHQSPPRRIHQEDLCQALGLTPEFKYQRADWQLPSYAALGRLLEEYSPTPGVERLAGASGAVFNYLVGNSDAHAKNISLLHTDDGVRLAPVYDVVSTAAYPDLHTDLALAIGGELDPDAIGPLEWADLASDFKLNPRAFNDTRRRLTERVSEQARLLADEGRADGSHDAAIDRILEVIAQRAPRVYGEVVDLS